MSDCGLRWTFGALAIVVGAGLARRGSRLLYDVEVEADVREHLAGRRWFENVQARNKAEATDRAMDLASESDLAEWDLEGLEFEVDFEPSEVVQVKRATLRDLRRQR